MRLKLVVITVLLFSTFVARSGNPISGLSELSGVVKGNYPAEISLYKILGKEVVKVASYDVNGGDGKFAFWIEKEPDFSYAVQINIQQLVPGKKNKTLKAAQFPLQFTQAGNFALIFDADKLIAGQKGYSIKSINQSGNFLLKGSIKGAVDDNGVVFNVFKNGVLTPVSWYYTTNSKKEFYFSVPIAEAGLYTVNASSWRTRFYAKNGTLLETEIDGNTGGYRFVKKNAENEILEKWSAYSSPLTNYGYNLIPGSFAPTAFDVYAKLVEGLHLSPEQFCGSQQFPDTSFRKLFFLAAKTDLQLAPLQLYHANVSQQLKTELKKEADYFPDVPAYFERFKTTDLFNDSLILKVPEAARLLKLRGMMITATRAAEIGKELEYSDAVKVQMDAVADKKVKALLLNQLLQESDIMNLTTFDNAFGEYQKYISNAQTKELYNLVRRPLISDTVFLGKPALPATLADTSGNRISLDELRGKVVFIDVWASWCGPCKKEFPYLKKLEEAYHGNSGIVFMGVSVDRMADKQKWIAMIREQHLPGYQLLDEAGSNFGKKLNISSIPRFMLVDKKGNWKEMRCPRPSDLKALKKYLDKALNE